MEQFLQLIVAGIARGSVIGLVAVGVVVVFSSTRLLNFAAGEFVMIGGLVSWFLLTKHGWPLLAALPIVLAAGAIFGVIVETSVVSPLRKRSVDPLAVVISLLGVSIVTAQIVQRITGPESKAVPRALKGDPLNVSGVVISQQSISMAIAAVIAVGAFTLIRQRTSLGLALRAVGSNRDGARVTGMNVHRLERGAFALAGAVSAYAGLFITPLIGWRPTMGLDVALLAFIAAIVGGITNPFAAFLGALLIGMASALIEGYISPLYSQAILFGVLILVVLVRPTGLIGSRETDVGPLRA
jgi:branched-chain amino acid transport system permease protein